MTVTIPQPATLATPSTKLETLMLSEPDMIAAGVKDMPKCVDTMVEMFRSLAVKDYRMGGTNADSHGSMVIFPEESPHPRMPKPTVDRRFMAMPAYLGGEFHLAGCKWYGSNIANREIGLPRSIHTFVLNDADTGAPLAIMNGNLLSAYRTGAISGVGARYLAKKDAKTVAIVGPGVMGKTALEAFAAGCPQLDTVIVKGRSQAGIDDFVSWVERVLPQFTTIEVAETEEEALRAADVVAYTTTAPIGSANYPTINPEWLKPGAFVALPSVVNVPDEFLTSGAKLVVDNTGLYNCWIEECGPNAHETVGIIGTKFVEMQHNGQLPEGAFADIADVIFAADDGKDIIRDSEDDIILMSVGGMPVEDVAWAKVVYETALEKGIGTPFTFWDEPEMA